MTTINKSRPIVKSAEKVLSVEVENPLMNTPVDLISSNKAGNRKRGRPKRPATATNETSESPEKKKIRGDKARDKASDKKKNENVKKCV